MADSFVSRDDVHVCLQKASTSSRQLAVGSNQLPFPLLQSLLYDKYLVIRIHLNISKFHEKVQDPYNGYILASERLVRLE